MSKRVRGSEGLKKRKLARQRFRNLIRSVIINRIWLVDSGDQKLSLNVKKNIALLVRTQRKIGLLTMAEKSLIRTPFSLRTIEERKQLVTLMAHLTCLSKIPPKVRARLAKVVTFLVIGGGRTIIKEGDPPSTVYFLLTGEVEVSKRTYDHITNQYVQNVDVIVGPGECIGHAEMLEDCPRRNTYVSTGVVELLVVSEDDFNEILRPTMSKQWQERKEAIQALEYFQYFTNDQLIDACRMSSLKQYDPLETIYYEDKGQIDDVHFVVSGACMILQCLKMRVTEKHGLKNYELMAINKEEDHLIFQDISKHNTIVQMLKNHNQSDATLLYDIDALIASDEEEKMMQEAKKKDLQSIEANCVLIREKAAAQAKARRQLSESIRTSSTTSDHVSPKYSKGKSILYSDNSDNLFVDEPIRENDAEYEEYSDQDEGIEKFSSGTERDSQTHIKDLIAKYELTKRKLEKKERKKAKQKSSLLSVKEEEIEEQSLNEATIDDVDERPDYIDIYGSSETEENVPSTPKKTVPGSTIENHFIDVGSLTFGGIFGLGEKMVHRVIMARTTVQCLVLPCYWLLRKTQNPGNIWQRRCFYLNSTIPSRETLFKHFLSTRQWQKFKKNIIEKSIQSNVGFNPTHIEDVPIICQIIEGNDN